MLRGMSWCQVCIHSLLLLLQKKCENRTYKTSLLTPLPNSRPRPHQIHKRRSPKLRSRSRKTHLSPKRLLSLCNFRLPSTPLSRHVTNSILPSSPRPRNRPSNVAIPQRIQSHQTSRALLRLYPTRHHVRCWPHDWKRASPCWGCRSG